MSVTSISPDQAAGVSGSGSSVRQARQDFNRLIQSLQSGNLSAAQQAYSSFQQIQTGPTHPPTTQASTVSATTTANPVASDWSVLGQALQSGNLSSAQNTLGQLTQDAEAAWKSRVQQTVRNAQSVYALMHSTQAAAAAPAATPVGTPTAAGSVQNDLDSLAQALQAGDNSSAQALLAQLQQDLQASGQASAQTHAGHHHHHHGGFSGTNVSSAYQSAAPAASAASTPAGATGAASGSGVSANV